MRKTTLFHGILDNVRAVAGIVAFVGVASMVPGPATLAVDGAIEVNQACAINTGCLPGDGPGFPITIGASATATSYVLTSDLVMSSEADDMFDIFVDEVTLDLNGFEMAWTGGAGAGFIDGIAANSVSGLTLQNGTIRDFPGTCVRGGSFAVIRNLKASGCGGDGLTMGSYSLLSYVVAEGNGGHGLSINVSTRIEHSKSLLNGANGVLLRSVDSAVHSSEIHGNGLNGIANNGNNRNADIRGNWVYDNLGDQIDLDNHSFVHDNHVVMSETGVGIRVGGFSSVRGNLVFNSSGACAGPALDLGGGVAYADNTIQCTGSTVVSGIDLGGNSCNGAATCP